MRVYEATCEDGHDWIVGRTREDRTVFHSLDGASRESSWCPVTVEVLRRREDGQPRLPAALPWMGTYGLVLTPTAVADLGPVLRPWGELLPLACDDAELVFYNALHVLDALDEERSAIDWFKSSGRVMKVRRYAFDPAAIGEVEVFKIPQIIRSGLFVTDRVADAFAQSGLRGTTCVEIWSDG